MLSLEASGLIDFAPGVDDIIDIAILFIGIDPPPLSLSPLLRFSLIWRLPRISIPSLEDTHSPSWAAYYV